MTYVLAIPLLPALAFVALAPLSRSTRARARWVAVLAVALAFALSLAAFGAMWSHGGAHEPLYHPTLALADIGGASLEVGLRLDPLSAAMVVVVTLVGLAVQVYSLRYMHAEERIGWYYAVLSLFTAAMLLLVLADGFLLLYLAWEVMGLCSYLLIGFWHEHAEPRRAALKAFLTTRVGDVGFALGLFAMFRAAGTFEFDAVLGGAASWAPGAATVVALLLLFGAMGKSAQVPLHVWLPDAMAGPTPASALIHAATMVAAGVYLVARALPIFEASGVALSVTLVVGALTALVGGLLATVQHDIKKVLAYSTISQLGYMFVGLGAAGAAAAAYHLVTHAFFKSLLFLGAGVIIHSCHTQDMREMGGLARRLPWTTATFTAGSLALAGIFPFSGFWSKDEILTVLLHGEHYVAFAAALGSAFVTAFYVARLWLRVFAGPAHADHAHEGHPTMLAPMVVLAALTAVVGFGGPALGGFLGHAIPWPEASTAAVSTAAALGGLALGWWVYGRPGAGERTARLRASAGFAYTALANKLYFDAAYERLVVRPYHALTGATAAFDLRGIDAAVNGVGEAWRRVSGIAAVVDLGVIDGSVNALAAGARRVGGLLRRVQAGRVQAYQRYVVGAVVLLLVAWIVGKGA